MLCLFVLRRSGSHAFNICLVLFHATGLHLPPAVKRRGQPEGHDVTVIGLPAKKKKKQQTCSFHAQTLI